MRRTILLLAIAASALLVASGVAVAVTSMVSGGAIDQVKVARSDEAFDTSSATYVDIPLPLLRLQSKEDNAHCSWRDSPPSLSAPEARGVR